MVAIIEVATPSAQGVQRLPELAEFFMVVSLRTVSHLAIFTWLK